MEESRQELLGSLEPYEEVFVLRDGEYKSVGFIRHITYSWHSVIFDVLAWEHPDSLHGGEI